MQQDDPLDPLLFCLTLEGAIRDCSREFVVAYLDDVTLGDTMRRLAVQVLKFQLKVKIGLSLILAKSEAWCMLDTCRYMAGRVPHVQAWHPGTGKIVRVSTSGGRCCQCIE